MMEKLYIVMPAYNEEANICNVVKEWYPVVEKIGNESRLVVVDDGSKDSTYRELQRLMAEYPLLVGLTKTNSGHGSTCLYAYQYAIEQGADYVFQTDSDGQTIASEFWDFWSAREHAIVIGKRTARMDGFSRVVVTKVLKMVVWFVFCENIADANTPFRLMQADKLKLWLQQIPKDFFLANVMVSVLAKRSDSMKWIPITFRQRQGGVNSINLKRISKIGIKAVKDFYKIKSGLSKMQ